MAVLPLQAPQELNLELYRGDDKDILIEVTNDLDLPYDFTDKTVEVHFKSKFSGVAILEKTEGSGITISGGDITITFTKVDFDTLVNNIYVYDLQVTDDITTKGVTWLKGDVSIYYQVTK